MLISIKQKEDMNIIIFIKLILTICLILFNYKILYFQKIYNNNQKNIVLLIFPQTIDFEKDKKEENNSRIIYSRHKYLTLIAREKESLRIMSILFKNNTIIFSPDMVTYLDNLIDLKNNKRKGALLLLRNDNETILNLTFKKEIFSLIKVFYKYVNFTDTVIDKQIITLEQSKEEVSNKLRQIASYEIVITDRLHGMIFCAITQTSCIVLRNFNHKILFRKIFIIERVVENK